MRDLVQHEVPDTTNCPNNQFVSQVSVPVREEETPQQSKKYQQECSTNNIGNIEQPDLLRSCTPTKVNTTLPPQATENTLNPLIIRLPSWNPLTAPKKNTNHSPKQKTSASARKDAPIIDTIAINYIPAD